MNSSPLKANVSSPYFNRAAACPAGGAVLNEVLSESFVNPIPGLLPAVEVFLGEAELAALLPRLDGAPLAHLGRQLVVHDALEAPGGVALGRRRQARLLRVDREHRELRRAQLTWRMITTLSKNILR